MFNSAHFHPMIVHFPVALILVGFLADVVFLFLKKELCLSKMGLYLMVLGTLKAGTEKHSRVNGMFAWFAETPMTLKPLRQPAISA
jgi:hypothetical protein